MLRTTRMRSTAAAILATAFAGVLLTAGGASASRGAEWNFAGGDLQNTRNQASEHQLSVPSVSGLTVKWTLTTGGDVSATPAVDDTTVYVPDWAGNLYAVDKVTGTVKWTVSIPAVTGVPFDKARATPAVTGDKVLVGTQGSILFGGGPGAKLLAFDKFTGAPAWSTQLDSHAAAIITQSATVFGNRVYVGVASQEEALAAFVPGYTLSFRGSMLALDLQTGAILWKTYTAPQGYTGNAVWGSSPAIDPKRGQIYIATGNNYSVPDDVLACVAAHTDPTKRAACLAPDDHFDSILALDMKTGAVRWAARAIPYDAWTVDCIPFFGDGDLCPEPAGPDYDFGQAPALFTTRDGNDRPIELVGAGQKSGQYWALDPDTGEVKWVTQAGPGGTAGGLQWGSAVDGRRVYTANANSLSIPWSLVGGGGTTTDGVWSGLDAATGEIIWQHTPSHGGSTSGPVTTANGVVYGCSLDALGYMYALNAATGAELWSFPSGGSCLSGAAISDGMLFWGSGYSNFGFGTPNHELYAFGLSG
jgi:polyvinyl alcohol dehydrogenase (cytochrome)